MAKKALISTIESRGQDNRGYRVVEVVDSGNEFEVHSSLQWKDCSDTIEVDLHWFDPTNNTFRKMPHFVDQSTAGKLAVDAEGNLTEEYEWSWATDTWSKVQIIDQ
jgi:hypothetical protein